MFARCYCHFKTRQIIADRDRFELVQTPVAHTSRVGRGPPLSKVSSCFPADDCGPSNDLTQHRYPTSNTLTFARLSLLTCSLRRTLSMVRICETLATKHVQDW
jgi:hypothetical protein